MYWDSDTFLPLQDLETCDPVQRCSWTLGVRVLMSVRIQFQYFLFVLTPVGGRALKPGHPSVVGLLRVLSSMDYPIIHLQHGVQGPPAAG